MPDQPELRQRLTRVLRDHSETLDIRKYRYGCVCGEWTGADLGEHWKHVAEVLIAELGLTQETAFRFTHKKSGLSSILTEEGDVRVARKITESHNLVEVSRYVTDWVPDVP